MNYVVTLHAVVDFGSGVTVKNPEKRLAILSQEMASALGFDGNPAIEKVLRDGDSSKGIDHRWHVRLDWYGDLDDANAEAERCNDEDDE